MWWWTLNSWGEEELLWLSLSSKCQMSPGTVTGSQARGAGTRLNVEPGCNKTISESAWPIQG